MAEEIYDVVLQTTGHFHASTSAYRANRPPEVNVDLGEQFWVGDLPYDLQPDIVLDACEPAGYKHKPARQYGMRYAFCRHVKPAFSELGQWDNDQVLGRMLFLSRLIRPTTISYSYAARIFFDGDRISEIAPGPTQGLGAHAFVVAKDDWRDWLSVPELNDLQQLSKRYLIDAPRRVRRARRHIDQAFHAYYLDQRVASLVTSFESLLKISKFQATKQFEVRVGRLAALLGYEINGAAAKEMYQDRSAFVHGNEVSFTDLSDELIAHYNLFESVLRLAILRASTEQTFASLFETDEAVSQAFGQV